MPTGRPLWSALDDSAFRHGALVLGNETRLAELQATLGRAATLASLPPAPVVPRMRDGHLADDPTRPAPRVPAARAASQEPEEARRVRHPLRAVWASVDAIRLGAQAAASPSPSAETIVSTSASVTISGGDMMRFAPDRRTMTPAR